MRQIVGASKAFAALRGDGEVAGVLLGAVGGLGFLGGLRGFWCVFRDFWVFGVFLGCWVLGFRVLVFRVLGFGV